MFRVGTTNESVRVGWIENTLKKIPAGLTLLDAGAGESQFKKFCGHLNYLAQDFGQYHGEGEVGLHTGSWDNSKLDIVSDITEIPLPDAAVDAVMCTEVFEHIPNAVEAIREFGRLVKPGGYLLITAPFVSITHFAPYHFATGFSRYFYEKHLAEQGFEIEDLQFNGNYFEFVAQETRRVKQIGEKYSGIKLSLFQKTVQHLWLKVLEGLSEKDKGSSELLSYGIHVFARKRQ
ncbi:MAG: class I SAM-dependent methyltransferase [Chitinophagaceae bacterium]|nr:MAG: class I SAM-dependent methyltransferase [Chitinophagaceae bacterium]